MLGLCLVIIGSCFAMAKISEDNAFITMMIALTFFIVGCICAYNGV